MMGDRLRTELKALERLAPDAAPPIVGTSRPRRWLSLGMVVGTVVAAAALTALVIGPLRSMPLGGASHSPNPAIAESRVGDFILTISSPKTSWTSYEAVEVSATLTYVGEQPGMSIGQGIPPITFELASGSGDGPRLVGIQKQPCVQYPVSADDPLVEPFRKGVVFTASDELADTAGPFDRAFLDASELRLPPGKWQFTAGTAFDEHGCGHEYRLEASIVLDVRDSPSRSPSHTSERTGELCRDSVIDRIDGYATNDEIERDLEVIEVALQDEPEYGGVYISDEKGARSGLEGVLLTTSCDIESMVPQILHPNRLRIQLVQRSLDDLRAVYQSITRAMVRGDGPTEGIVEVGLDTIANSVRVAFLEGTEAAKIVAGGGVPAAFAGEFGTKGIVFAVVDELPAALPVPGLPLPSASEIPRWAVV
jgi:hypothetical protein